MNTIVRCNWFAVYNPEDLDRSLKKKHDIMEIIINDVKNNITCPICKLMNHM